MKLTFAPLMVAATFVLSTLAAAQDHPYLTTQSPITLFNTSDGEFEASRTTHRIRPYDYKLKTDDSFTVIHLGPDHPPIVKTVYGTIPATILGPGTMAMSKDGKYAMVTNTGLRPKVGLSSRLSYPTGVPLTNEDLTSDLLKKQKLSPQLSDMLSVIDLSKEDYPVVQRLLFDDHPINILPHPDGRHFLMFASRFFYVLRLDNGHLTEVSRFPNTYGLGSFWIHPKGDRIFSTQNASAIISLKGGACQAHWFAFEEHKIRYLSEVKVAKGVDSALTDQSFISRISQDGKWALICQRTRGNDRDLCDVLIADLTLDPPAITRAIKQVGDGLENFAFHPNGKMVVAACLENTKNSLAVLDIASSPPRLLYHLDAAGSSQGAEFSPDGDKLFVGSADHGRIEVYDFVGEFELRKNQKFIKIGYGHNSLTIGPRYFPKKSSAK